MKMTMTERQREIQLRELTEFFDSGTVCWQQHNCTMSCGQCVADDILKKNYVRADILLNEVMKRMYSVQYNSKDSAYQYAWLLIGEMERLYKEYGLEFNKEMETLHEN